MREIKFRAWDKEQKRMFDVYGINTDHIAEDSYDSSDNSIHPRKTCILMQYTGLKDRNGKEIYEGDIILFSLNTGEKVKDTIVFEMGGFRTDKRNFPLTFYWSIEVIGNIYENKELL